MDGVVKPKLDSMPAWWDFMSVVRSRVERWGRRRRSRAWAKVVWRVDRVVDGLLFEGWMCEHRVKRRL